MGMGMKGRADGRDIFEQTQWNSQWLERKGKNKKLLEHFD